MEGPSSQAALDAQQIARQLEEIMALQLQQSSRVQRRVELVTQSTVTQHQASAEPAYQGNEQAAVSTSASSVDLDGLTEQAEALLRQMQAGLHHARVTIASSPGRQLPGMRSQANQAMQIPLQVALKRSASAYGITESHA